MIWEAILKIKSKLGEIEGCLKRVEVDLQRGITVKVNESLSNPTFCITLKERNNDLIFPTSGSFDLYVDDALVTKEDKELLKLYLPYALIPYFSKVFGRCYSISHFAQTLDGRIASFTGDSKWIGNKENLVHAHRMRALCDAILIGAKTLGIDNPKLNVRHVSGLNPRKIIIGGDDLEIEEYPAIDSSTIIFCQNHSNANIEAERIVLDKKPLFDSKEILDQLWKKGICSVYIEGGSFTTSTFLKEGLIDQVQVHISPQILGAGTTSFDFEGINKMEDSIKFSESRFISLGDDIMFIGNRKS